MTDCLINYPVWKPYTLILSRFSASFGIIIWIQGQDGGQNNECSREIPKILKKSMKTTHILDYFKEYHLLVPTDCRIMMMYPQIQKLLDTETRRAAWNFYVPCFFGSPPWLCLVRLVRLVRLVHLFFCVFFVCFLIFDCLFQYLDQIASL